MICALAFVFAALAISPILAYPVDPSTTGSAPQPSLKSVKLTLNCGCWNDCTIERVVNPKITDCLDWCDPKYTCPDLPPSLPTPTPPPQPQQARGLPVVEPVWPEFTPEVGPFTTLGSKPLIYPVWPELGPEPDPTFTPINPVTDPVWPRFDPESGPTFTPDPKPVTDPVPDDFSGIFTLPPITKTKGWGGPTIPTGIIPDPLPDNLPPDNDWTSPLNPVVDPPEYEAPVEFGKRSDATPPVPEPPASPVGPTTVPTPEHLGHWLTLTRLSTSPFPIPTPIKDPAGPGPTLPLTLRLPAHLSPIIDIPKIDFSGPGVIWPPINPVVDPPKVDVRTGREAKRWDCDPMPMIDVPAGSDGDGPLVRRCDPTPWDGPSGPDSDGLVVKREVGVGECKLKLDCSPVALSGCMLWDV
ncbi:hypothetical protein B0T16DRAFT_506652 [Cercophora newfieldiana]|uniref:Uncharacterized protein n=1 Tax=Cercophora newfieldiana TaxID=92897 RepID=A0AA39YC81_9PEZI|nr:hypothetical protein B0T16DRAFT_506652 [Cercophora newfieldiana]